MTFFPESQQRIIRPITEFYKALPVFIKCCIAGCVLAASFMLITDSMRGCELKYDVKLDMDYSNYECMDGQNVIEDPEMFMYGFLIGLCGLVLFAGSFRKLPNIEEIIMKSIQKVRKQ